MKQQLLLVLCMLSCVFFVSAQSQRPLKDAIDYRKAMDDKQGEKALRILRKYDPDLLHVKSNVLIEYPDTLAHPMYLSFFSDKEDLGNVNEFQSSSASMQGLLIDAIGTVIADRFREELTLAFLQDFRTKLEADTLLGNVFPNTRSILLYSDPFNYKVWMASFRVAMEKDLKSLPTNFPYLIDAIGEETGLTQKQITGIKEAVSFYPLIQDVWENPSHTNQLVVKSIEKLEGYCTSTEGGNSLALTRMIVDGLSSDGKSWASEEDLTQLFSDAEVFKTFIALVIEKNEERLEKIAINTGNKVRSVYEVFHTDDQKKRDLSSEGQAIFRQISDVVQLIVSDCRAIQAAYKELDDNKYNMTGGFTVSSFDGMVSSVLNLLSDLTGPQVSSLTNSTDSEDFKKLKDLLDKVRVFTAYAQSVTNHVEKKKYAAIVVETVELLEETVEDSEKLQSNRYVLEFMKYASLAANLASAETSEEMAEAINTSILPVGSYRVKRNSYFSMSVNAYAGLFGGGEVLSNDLAQNQTNGLLGFTAPVGIGLNWGLKKSKRSEKTSQLAAKVEFDSKGKPMDKSYFRGSSISLFFSVIDVGAITAFRLQDDETPIDNVQWSNIIAPGIYLSYGIRNTPLAINFGGQYGPALRTVEAVDGNATLTIDSRAFRFGVGIVADIPFYNLYSRSERVVVK